MLLGTSGFFYPVKAVEDLFFVFIGNTDTVVPDRYDSPVFVMCKRKFYFAMFRRIADRIVQKDGDDLADTLRVHGA